MAEEIITETNRETATDHAYGGAQIQVLEGLEAVRKRPGMYIGSTGPSGLHHLVYEIVDNAIDEALAGYCTHIEVTIKPGNIIEVSDNGRGIPVDIQPKLGIPAVTVVYTVLHAGGKFGGEDSGYKVAGGLHGVGASVVNALSEWLTVRVRRDGAEYEQSFKRGKPDGDLKKIGAAASTGTTVTFKPDPEMFQETTMYRYETLLKRLREEAFLNAGVRITLTDERPESDRPQEEKSEGNEVRTETMCYEGGIRSFVSYLCERRDLTPLTPQVMYMKGEGQGAVAEVALQYYDNSYNELLLSFANNVHTPEGGTHEEGFKLVVTVDNGISAIEEAACAKELGLDLIVTDHHLPGETLPDAVAVVDPKRADDESPFKDLCGAGVAFKLCAALEGCEPADLLEMYGELVALGTVADVMPLVGENRTLVREGLALLQDTMRPGLQALMENAGVAGKPVTADTVSYSLAPRLNAAGRMDNAAVALKLLLCTDEAQAAGIAARLAEINTERQQTEQEVFAAAQKTLEADPARQRDRVLVVSGEDWHPGVIGIVAARLMEKYNRPAIVISLQNGEGRGSGRAPDPFDLHGALAGCAQYLTRFGGHAAAAGVEIEEEKLPAFRQAINAWAAEYAPRPGAPELKLDAAVQLSELTLPNVQELSRLAPFGRENPMPVLLVCDAMIDGIWPMGAEGRHTRVRLRQGNDTLFASIFGVAPSAFAYPVGTAVEAALEVSIFTGRSGPMVSAHLRAIRPAGLGNLPSEQAAWFEAFRTGGTLEPARAAALLPDRADTVMLYKRIRGGQVASGDLQPVFAAQGPENTGKTLTSLAALHELGLIQEQNGHWLPVPVTTKQDLASAPILQKLAAVVK